MLTDMALKKFVNFPGLQVWGGKRAVYYASLYNKIILHYIEV